MKQDADRPTAELFDPLVGDKFQVHLDEGQIAAAELIVVTRLQQKIQREDLPIRKDPFSIVFRVANGVAFDQRICRVEHPTIGTTEMFLVPIGFQEYEALFN